MKFARIKLLVRGLRVLRRMVEAHPRATYDLLLWSANELSTWLDAFAAAERREDRQREAMRAVRS